MAKVGLREPLEYPSETISTVRIIIASVKISSMAELMGVLEFWNMIADTHDIPHWNVKKGAEECKIWTEYLRGPDEEQFWGRNSCSLSASKP